VLEVLDVKSEQLRCACRQILIEMDVHYRTQVIANDLLNVRPRLPPKFLETEL